MVFLSYAREDATLVDHLERTLYDCGVPVCKMCRRASQILFGETP
jgi:hypothetical protein